MTAAAPPPTDVKSSLEELRASAAAEAARRGLRGAIAEAILGLLNVLLAMLADFQAGRLASPAPVAGGTPAGEETVEAAATVRAAGPAEGADGARPGLRGEACQPAALLLAGGDSADARDARTADPYRLEECGREADERAQGGAHDPGAAEMEPASGARRIAAGPAPRAGRTLHAVRRPARFGMTGRTQRSAARRITPCIAMAGAGGERFFKNASWRGGIGVSVSFQHENDAAGI